MFLDHIQVLDLFQSAPRSFDRSVAANRPFTSDTALFQSAPRSFDRSVLLFDKKVELGEVVSIRTPVLRPECLGRLQRLVCHFPVSIRTPVLRPECLPERARTLACFVFQSAPRSFDRSVLALSWSGRLLHQFQSAPRSFDRSVGSSPWPRREVNAFQSAPRSFDRSVAAAGAAPSSRWCFNPHPGPSTGVSGRRRPRWRRPCCFNPHPGPSTGVSAHLL